MKYWVLKSSPSRDAAYLSALPLNGPKAYKYNKGISLKENFPPPGEAEICFSASFPDTIKLNDFVGNIDSVLIVSEKVKILLESLPVKNIEYLQVTLLDHQENIASNDYYILNVLGSIDCVDMDKSDVVMDPMFEDRVHRFKNLVIDESKIPENSMIFRLSVKTNEYIINDDLRKIFEENNITDYKLLEAQGWDGLDI